MRPRLLRALARQIQGSWRRATVLGMGILVAATAFSLLTAASDTSQARVRGTVSANFQSSYDLLVRPSGSRSQLERRKGLVRNNFETGIYGGITLDQWRRIQDIPGISVAAPVAYLGWVNQRAYVEVRIGRFMHLDEPVRVRVFTTSQVGRPAEWVQRFYVVVTRSGICPKVFVQSAPQQTAFSANDFGFCLVEGGDDSQSSGHVASVAETKLGTMLSFPMLVAAVDPVQEDRLVGLDRAVTQGEPLTVAMRSRVGPSGPILPVLASSRSYRSQTTSLVVEKLRIRGPHPERAMVAPAPGGKYGEAESANWTRLNGTPGTRLGTISLTAGEMYAALRHAWTLPIGDFHRSPSSISWAAQPVSYAVNPDGSLSPKIVKNDPVDTWRNQLNDPFSPFLPTAPENADTQFRRLIPQPYIGPRGPAGSAGYLDFKLVGQYDPEKLPGFNVLSRVPLETYRSPLVEPGDAATRKLLDGQPLGPTSNLGGYVAQPPFLLTTLSAAEAMTSPKWFGTRAGKPLPNAFAPISVIRVKVAGITGPDQTSVARLRAAATAINRTTGLTVDITAGSSPQAQSIRLPASKLGAPAMTLREGWTHKGVALLIVAAVDRKSVLLFVLILAISVSFLASGSYAAVRLRRAEFGTLATFGWSPGQVSRLIVGEMALIGAVAGVAGAALSASIIAATGLELTLTRVLLIPPVAVGLAVAAGSIPGWAAARTTPMAALQPLVSDAGWSHRRPRGLIGYAGAGLLRRPGRTALAAGTLAVAVACLATLLAVTIAFRGTVSGSLLGNYVTVQIRTVDYVSAALSILLACFAVADLLALTLRERTVELVTLKATGWSNRHLVTLAATEAAVLASVGAVPGAAAAVAAGLLLHVSGVAVAASAITSAGTGILLVVAFAAVPAASLGRLRLSAVLADE